MNLNIGINASRARSGGAIGYPIGILHNLSRETLNINSIHLWSFQELLLQVESFRFHINSQFILSGALTRPSAFLGTVHFAKMN